MKETVVRFEPVEMELTDIEVHGDVSAAVDVSGPDSVLNRAVRPIRQGEVVGRLAHSRLFVRQDQDIDAVASAINKAPALYAIGVVDESGTPVGIVLRRELFEVLGRPYGRELFKKKPVSTVMKASPVFRDDLNILSVAETLKEEVRGIDDTYYLLVDATGAFSGVFSTKNILVYLSDTTARDIALARRLQSAIVHESYSLNDPRCSLLCFSKMAKEVGGDFYLVKRLPSDRLLLCMCDVSGKGIAASLVTAVLGGIFDTYTGTKRLDSFLEGVNRYMFETFRLEYFVTGIFVELDLATGSAIVCDMGHSYVLAMEGTTLFHLGRKGANPPLGVVPDLLPRLSGYRFPAGGRALLFTDGVVEQTNREGQEYSERRLWQLMKSTASRPPTALRDALSADFEAFRGQEPQGDDVTFMILQMP